MSGPALLASTLVALAMLCAACEARAPAPPAQKAAAAPKPPLTAPYEGGPLTVGEAGVGPIRADTPISADALAVLFPDAEVKAAFLDDGVTQIPVITVFHETEMLRLDGSPGRPGVVRVHVTGGPAVGPRGERLMAPFQGMGFSLSQCWDGKGADLGAAVCRRTRSSRLTYVFGVPGWAGATAPPADQLAAKGFLRELVWDHAAPAASPSAAPPV